MKLLFVCHHFPPYNTAGAQLFALYLAKELCLLDHEVEIFYPVNISHKLAPKSKKYSVKTSTYQNLIVHEVVVDDTSGGIFEENPSYYYDNHKINQIFKDLLLKNKYDIIHFHLLHRLGFGLPIVAKILGIPSLITLHDYWFLCPRGHMIDSSQNVCEGPESEKKCAACLDYLKYGKLYSLLRLFRKFRFFKATSVKLKKDIKINKKVLNYVRNRAEAANEGYHAIDVRISPSEYLAQTYASFGLKKPEVLPIGWIPLKRKENQKPPGHITFGFAGQIIPRKGLDVLIKAFSRIKGDCSLHIYGEINDEAYFIPLKQCIEKHQNMTYFGCFCPNDLQGIYNSIDVMVVPSRRENYPLTILEALSTQTPVIASNVGGVSEIIKHSDNGWIFKNEDTKELSGLLQSIVDGPDKIEKVSSNITPIKSIEENAREYQKIYDTLLRSSE